MCSVYYLLGFVTPFAIRGKELIQDLARERIGCAWDEPLREQHLSSWQEWLRQLEAISAIKISRCLYSLLNMKMFAELNCITSQMPQPPHMDQQVIYESSTRRVKLAAISGFHDHASPLSGR